MVAALVGQYGSLKSFVALSAAFSVATGKPWLGHATHQTGLAVYASLEGGYTLRDRYAGWLEHHESEPPEQLLTWPHPLNILDREQVEPFIEWLTEHRPLLTVIDTMAKATAGADENSSADWGKAAMRIAEMRDATGGTVIVVHHTGHNANGRG